MATRETLSLLNLLYHEYSEPERPSHVQAIQALTQAMEKGEVETLLILGGNPVYNAPADLAFAEKLKKVPQRIHLSLYDDETSRACNWHLPRAHTLESWGDTDMTGTHSAAH